MEIPEIKQRLSIQTVLQHYGLQPDKNHMLRCPFHDDDKPSMKIYHATDTFNCFGCGKTGDTIQFIGYFEQISKHESILRAKELIKITEIPKSEAKSGTKAKSMIIPGTTNINNKAVLEAGQQPLPRMAILNKIALDSKASFKRTTLPQDYLKSRKLDITKLDVGYISNQFGKGWNKELRESGLKLGVLKQSRQNTIVPKFNHVALFLLKMKKAKSLICTAVQ